MKSNPVILGIEGTAHTCGIGIIRGDQFLSDERAIYVPEKGGIHPREAAQFLCTHLPATLRKAVQEAKISYEDIDAIAFSQGPGMGPCLRTTATASRALSLALGKSLIGVNHCVAHIELAKTLTGAKDPICVYVSGGNTQVTVFGNGRYRVMGETLDVALGNALDTIGREIGLKHPGGPEIEAIAQEGTDLLDLPYVVKGMSLSYSGLVSAAARLHKSGVKIEDLCFTIQEVFFSMLVEVAERALSCTEKEEIILTGGVAANKRLQEMIKEVAREQGVFYGGVPLKLAGDNGIMIATTGKLQYDVQDFLSVPKSQVRPRWRVDEVDIPW